MYNFKVYLGKFSAFNYLLKNIYFFAFYAFVVGKCFVTIVHIVIKSEKIGIIEIFISFLTDNKILF